MIVYLDIDGVLVNFNESACAFIDALYPPSKWHWFEDIPNGFNKVNDKCNIDFWVSLEWMPDGKKILEVIEKKFKQKNIYLVTAPMLNPGSGTGKMLWVEKNLSSYYKRLIITSAPKSLFANSNTLLIDDKDENINEFVNAGGEGILIPRLWNSLHGWSDKTLQIIKNSLRGLK